VECERIFLCCKQKAAENLVGEESARESFSDLHVHMNHQGASLDTESDSGDLGLTRFCISLTSSPGGRGLDSASLASSKVNRA